ncbi:hypothetical protein HDV01_004229 [Terramyces sp. JEL0728]|nr:hypothetical protein HDV01_004229 [Terramyces sp. JEL0728]
MDGDGPLRRTSVERYEKPKPKGWIPDNKWSRYLLQLSFLQAIIISAFELFIAIQYRQFLDSNLYAYRDTDQIPNVYKNGAALTVYHGLFIVAQLFQLLLTADALKETSLIQLVTTFAFNFALFVYSIMQSVQAQSWANSVASILPGINAHPTAAPEVILIVLFLISLLGSGYLTWKLYYVFGWTIYKELGCDLVVRNVTYLYHIYVRKENKYLVYLTLAGLLTGFGYLISKLWNIWVDKEPRFDSSKNSLTFFIAITMLLVIATMAVAWQNMTYFGKGLLHPLESQETFSDEGEELRNMVQV